MSKSSNQHQTMDEEFKQIFQTHWKKLYAIAYHRLHDEDLAKDIVQDVFVYYLSNRQKINITISIEAYLRKALQYQIIAHYRKSMINERAVAYLIDSLGQTEIGMQDPFAQNELSKTINKEVNTMPISMRDIFNLKLKDYSVEEIALETGLAEKTIRNNISIGLVRLRKVIKEEFPEDFPALCIALYILLNSNS